MGSATREASSTARAALAAQGAVLAQSASALAVGEQLLAAGRVMGDSAQLRSTFADPSVPDAEKKAVVGKLFGSTSAATRSVLDAVVTSRWSSHDDMLAGVEELGFGAVAASAGSADDIVAEIFSFGRAVTSDSELELAIGSKLGSADAKLALVDKLLGGKASAQALAIVRHLVQQPRGRRIRALVTDATNTVAREGGFAIATVTVARELDAAQLKRLTAGLSARFGELRINQVVDPSLIGGLRVQVGDDVIDDSIATKLGTLKLQLAG